jgi:hypothetical protein
LCLVYPWFIWFDLSQLKYKFLLGVGASSLI